MANCKFEMRKKHLAKLMRRYLRRHALESGEAVEPWMLDDDLPVAEGEPINCRRCGNSAPAQHGRNYNVDASGRHSSLALRTGYSQV
jgi:hypothetical protein